MTTDEYQKLRAERAKEYMHSANLTQELLSTYSDYHKDTYGFRPKFDKLPYRQQLCDMLAAIDCYHAVMRETFVGREQLRADGWVIEETDPVLQVMADHLASMREEGDADGLWRAEIVH